MAVARIAWDCPQCGRSYAIRADRPEPRHCPNCAAPGEAALHEPADPERFAADGDSPPAPPSSDPDSGLELFPEIATDEIDPDATTSAVRNRRGTAVGIPEARHIAVIAYAGGVLVLIIAGVCLAIAGVERNSGLALLGAAGLLGGILSLGVGAVVRLLIRIEAHTRPRD